MHSGGFRSFLDARFFVPPDGFERGPVLPGSARGSFHGLGSVRGLFGFVFLSGLFGVLWRMKTVRAPLTLRGFLQGDGRTIQTQLHRDEQKKTHRQTAVY